MNTNKAFATVIMLVGTLLAGLLLSFGAYVFWVKTAPLFTGFWATALQISRGVA